MKAGPLLWVVADMSPANAGFRIRTEPIVNALRARGQAVETVTYQDLLARMPAEASRVSAVVLSKPNDSTAMLAMRAFQERGIPVAVDVFDNYLSHSPGVVHRELHWQWVRMLEAADLVLTSTPFLEQVVGTVRKGPILRMADPLPQLAPDTEESRLAKQKWPRSGRLKLIWFGMPSNGVYPVGLDDLVAWRQTLDALRTRFARLGGIELTLCTSRGAALDATVMSFRREGIPTRFVEWTEATCSRLVADSHVVLLPTNLSGFSLSKTHNRCSDALIRGGLVLASPDGPYRTLGGAVCTSVEALLAQLVQADRDPTWIESATASSLARLQDECDLARNAARLHKALDLNREISPPNETPRVLLVARARIESVKLSRRLGYLTAGFTDGLVKATLDMSLQSGPAPGVWARVQLSANGWQMLQRAVTQNPDLDVASNDTHLDCRFRGWHLLFNKAAVQLDVLQIPDPALTADLAVLHLLSVNAPQQVSRWYDIQVDLLTRLLRILGLDRVDFATEEGGGWRAFARHADPMLEQSMNQLERMWDRHGHCERDWGQTLESQDVCA
jgi:hypothetical protein